MELPLKQSARQHHLRLGRSLVKTLRWYELPLSGFLAADLAASWLHFDGQMLTRVADHPWQRRIRGRRSGAREHSLPRERLRLVHREIYLQDGAAFSSALRHLLPHHLMSVEVFQQLPLILVLHHFGGVGETFTAHRLHLQVLHY